jgi:hypothetical protein
VAGIFFGVKKWSETWDWYLDRFRDGPILAAVKKPQFRTMIDVGALARRPSFGQTAAPTEKFVKQVPKGYKPEAIAQQVSRKEKSVLASLRRLERRGKVVVDGFGEWFLKA